MSSPAAESRQNDQAIGLGLSGIIVLSTSGRLRFINQKALNLLDLLDQDVSVRTEKHVLPPCIMAMVEEILAVDSIGNGVSDVPPAQVTRLLGPSSQAIRVQGFTSLSREGQDRTIVLVLSQRDTGAM